MQRTFRTAIGGLAALAAVLAATSAGAADVPGWITLFNGKSLEHFQTAAGQAPGAGWVVDDGAMIRREGTGDIWTKERFGDFVLELEFKTVGNSGIFIRTDNPKDPVQTGIEIQVDKPSRGPSKHSCGAVYDAEAPKKEASKANAWNRAVITAKGSQFIVVMNGEEIVNIDLDRWTEAHKNPDGTPNKYNKPLSQFAREGHIGFQDHGAVVAFRKVRIRALK